MSHKNFVLDTYFSKSFIHKEFKSRGEGVHTYKVVAKAMAGEPLILPWNSKDKIFSISLPTVLPNSTKDIMGDKRRIYENKRVLIPYLFFSLFPDIKVVVPFQLIHHNISDHPLWQGH